MKMTDPDVLRWVDKAKSYSPDLKLPRPFHVLMGEAVDAAREFTDYFEPEKDPHTGQITRRGLRSVNRPGNMRLPASSGEELLSIQLACQHAHGQYLYLSGSVAQKDVTDRARFLLGEIKAVLHYHLDDGVEDENDAALASVDAEHAEDPQTADALAGALDDYAGLARPFADQLDGLGGFEVGYLDEAETTAAQLRQKPARAAALPKDAAAWLALRNQLTNLLQDRMRRINSAGKLVFRDRPDIARKFASGYERSRRAEARRRAKKAEEAKKSGAGAVTTQE
jgi:hypothetical protein